jgi:hypothetical protein
MTTVEVLRAARAKIERGWCQHAYQVGADVCAMGAILYATDPCRARTGAIDVLAGAIGGKGICDWNDSPLRTQAEVLAAFDKAITLAEAP